MVQAVADVFSIAMEDLVWSTGFPGVLVLKTRFID